MADTQAEGTPTAPISFHAHFPSKTAWAKLLELAPHLRTMNADQWGEQAIPASLGKMLFLSLVACFADKAKREVMRAILFDLLEDDIVDLIAEAGKEVG